jgi:hypothetical protein
MPGDIHSLGYFLALATKGRVYRFRVNGTHPFAVLFSGTVSGMSVSKGFPKRKKGRKHYVAVR